MEVGDLNRAGLAKISVVRSRTHPSSIHQAILFSWLCPVLRPFLVRHEYLPEGAVSPYLSGHAGSLHGRLIKAPGFLPANMDVWRNRFFEDPHP
jgi:hypothetical protein